MAGLFSGRAANALNAGTVEYAAAMAAANQVNDRLDLADHRTLQRRVASAPGLAPRTMAGGAALGVPGPLTATQNLDPYSIGSTYTPAGITPPAGAAIPVPTADLSQSAPGAAPAMTPEAAAAFTSADGAVLTPSIQEWKSMTGQQQAAHLAAVNAAEAAKVSTRTAWSKGTIRPKVISLKEYEATLPREPAARRGGVKTTKPVQTSGVAQAMQTPQGAKIVEYARAVGLNPAVAMTTYGVESSFGAAKVSSFADAKAKGGVYGIMQTQVASIFGDGGNGRGVLAHFSDPQVLAKYPSEANNIAALVRMVQADPDSEDGQIAAGILRLKYSQDIGVPESLMGAAYQASAEEVLKAGGPTGASDGNLTNSGYNSRWQGVLAEVQSAMGGMEGIITPAGGTPDQPAAPQVQAGLASTGDKSFDSRVKFALKKAPAEYDFQTQQSMQLREQQVQFFQQRQQLFEQENQRITQEHAQSSQRFAVYKANGDIAGMEAEMNKLDAAQSLLNDLQTRSYAFAVQAQKSINASNNELLANESDRAVRELANGDPRRASALISSAGGSQIVFQPRTDGGFVAVGPDGGYILERPGGVAKRFTAEDVAKQVYDVADKAKAAAVDAGRASASSKKYESDLKIEEAKVDIIGKLLEINAKSVADLEAKMKEQDSSVHSVKEDTLGNIVIVYNGPSGRIVTLAAEATQAVLNGDEIPTTSVKVQLTGDAGLTPR